MTTAEGLIRGSGLRSTVQRRAVLEALMTRPHVTAVELAGHVTGTLSHQGLYNVLEDLTRAGIVRCIEPAGSPARYETRVGDNHHHLVCRRCGRVTDLDCPAGAAPCLLPATGPSTGTSPKIGTGPDSATGPNTATGLDTATGFAVIDEAEITWWGVCTPCFTSAAEQDGRGPDDGRDAEVTRH